MDARPDSRLQETRHGALVGFELGMLGGALMLVWFALISPVLGQHWWTVPNLFASKFFTARVVRGGAGMVTLVGMSLHLIVAGLMGLLLGVFSPLSRIAVLGAVGLWYALGYFYLWERTAPLLLTDAAQPVLAFGFFIYGSTVGFHQSRRRG